MGFFDGLGAKLQSTVQGAVSGGTATVYDYFNATTQSALVQVGLAPSSNLTEAEINAGKTATPEQLHVVPSKASATDIMGATPFAFLTEGGSSKTILLLAAAAVAVYFIAKKR